MQEGRTAMMMGFSSKTRRSLAHSSKVRQTLREEERLNKGKQHSWVKTMMMSNPITAPMVIMKELFFQDSPK
jgi:hypothetical protein